MANRPPIGCFAKVFLALISSTCIHPIDHSILVIPKDIF